MEVHTWKERTEEGTLVYRACHHASKWKLECAPKVGRAERDDVEWEHVEFTRAHWVTLRDVLWRKYQRKRCPWRFIEAIDKLLEDMPEEEETGSPMGRTGGRNALQLLPCRGCWERFQGMALLGVPFRLRVVRTGRTGRLSCLSGMPGAFRAH